MNSKKMLVIFILITLLLPVTVFFGISEHTRLFGVEKSVSFPSVFQHSFVTGEYQKHFAEYWKFHFGFRAWMVRSKNQVYAWLNFGKIYSDHTVVRGKQKYLFAELYFSSLKQKCNPLPVELYKIKKVQSIFERMGIDFIVILAPNKAVTYWDWIPSRYKFFLDRPCSYYQSISHELRTMGIKVFDAQSVASTIRQQESYPPFASTGMHWNHYAAGRSLQEIAKEFHWGTINSSEVIVHQKPFTTETDLSRILNLWTPYDKHQRFYKLKYERLATPLLKSVTLIGNSFSNEFKYALLESGAVLNLTHFGNKPLKKNNLLPIRRSKLIFFLYTDTAIMNVQHQMYRKIDFLLEHLQGVRKKNGGE